jgi:hypothetical protein
MRFFLLALPSSSSSGSEVNSNTVKDFKKASHPNTSYATFYIGLKTLNKMSNNKIFY